MITARRSATKKFYFDRVSEQMETIKRFPVFESYATSIKRLYTTDKAIAGELSYRVIQYGIYGTPPPKDTNQIVLALFEQIKHAIDKGRAQIINGSK